MAVKKRIGLIGYRLEAMLACPVLTDGSTTELVRGADILALKQPVVTGVVEAVAADADFELVPLMFGRMVPGGPLAPAFYDALKAESLQLLHDHGPFDGLVIANHGAGEVAGLGRHGDTDYILAIRQAVGPDVVIAVPFDHHGQVTEQLLAAIDTLSALRTAPHRDTHETSARATTQLMEIVRTGRKPYKAGVRIPIYVPGEKAMTTFSPARELFGMLPEYDAMTGGGEAHIFVGFGWNDVPWCGMQTIVTHFESAEKARDIALEIAEAIWQRRHDFRLQMQTATIAEGLAQAASMPGKRIYLADSGDNTTAGAGGDLTFVLQDALDMGLEDIVIGGIFDATVVQLCHAAGVGADVQLPIGAHVSARQQIRTVAARVVALGASYDMSAYSNAIGSSAPWATIAIEGVTASFHAARVSYTSPEHFAAAGISPDQHKVYVVKVGYLHPAQEDFASAYICLLSEGVSALDFTAIPYARIPSPAFPMDADMTWSSDSGIMAPAGEISV